MKRVLIYLGIYVGVTLVLWVAIGFYFGTHPWPEDFCEGAPDVWSWQYWKECLPALPATFVLALVPTVIVIAIVEVFRFTPRSNKNFCPK